MGKPANPTGIRRGKRGFVQTGALLTTRIRNAGEKRGFAESRLLTRWEEICGKDLAAMVRPLKVSYARDGFGATLTVTCDGAHAPEVQMQTQTIRERVNACYGYSAISRVRITQTDAAGFAEAQARYIPATSAPIPQEPTGPAPRAVEDVHDTALREALARLGRNILARKGTTEPKENT